MIKKSLGSLVLAITLYAAPSHAATIFMFESRELDPSNPAAEVVRISAEGAFLKIETEIGEDGRPDTSIIFNDKNDSMTIIDHAGRNYMVMDREMIEGFGAQISSAMTDMQKQMETAMANMPPEQREMMKKMMKDRMPSMAQEPSPPKTELRKTSRRETAGDYTCIVWDVMREGEKIREHCVSSWKEVGLPPETIELLKNLGSFFEETLGAMAKNMPGGGAPQADNPFGELEQMDAFPVLTREFENGEPTSENVLRSVTRETLDPDAFEPPSGYSRREIGMANMPG